MQDNVRPLRGGDSEKITINLGYVDLGRVDLLVQDGFYSNRTDFIRTAIRNQLATHAPEVARSIERQTLEVGLRDFAAAELESLRARGQTISVRVLGLARIAPDVSPELAEATIASLTVLGALQASPAVKSALAGRIR
jgi:Arc/MetJ-type ribon-helix-helix transcriptional regulator